MMSGDGGGQGMKAEIDRTVYVVMVNKEGSSALRLSLAYSAPQVDGGYPGNWLHSLKVFIVQGGEILAVDSVEMRYVGGVEQKPVMAVVQSEHANGTCESRPNVLQRANTTHKASGTQIAGKMCRMRSPPCARLVRQEMNAWISACQIGR